MRVYTIYVATNTVNGKRYVGFDSSWPRRKQSHKNEAYNSSCHTYNTAFHCAIRKYGWDAFKWDVVYQSKDKDATLLDMERHFITEFHTHVGFSNSKGYNMTLGGEGQVGRVMSEVTRQKKSVALRGKPSKMSRRISTPHGMFDGVGVAAHKLNMNIRTITYRLQRTSFPDWFYVDGNNLKTGTVGRRGKSRQVSTPHGIFASIAECSKSTGIPKSTISDLVLSVHHPDWFYTGVETKVGIRAVITPSGRFISIADAGRMLGIPKSTIVANIKSKQKPGWYYEDQPG